MITLGKMMEVSGRVKVIMACPSRRPDIPCTTLKPQNNPEDDIVSYSSGCETRGYLSFQDLLPHQQNGEIIQRQWRGLNGLSVQNYHSNLLLHLLIHYIIALLSSSKSQLDKSSIGWWGWWAYFEDEKTKCLHCQGG